MGKIKLTDKQASIIEELESLPVNHFLNAVEEASKARGKKIDRFVADAVAKDIQAHLTAAGFKPSCPNCKNKDVSRNGKRGEIQRYRCKECGTSFTAFSGSILEKTRYTWSVWVEVITGLLNHDSVEATRQKLELDYKCTRIDWKTVWGMRLKVMYAISQMPPVELRGIVSIDDTFVREGQKGSRGLENPLPKDISKIREPRYGRVPSKLGIRGNEFATVTTMIDQSRHCVCKILGFGAIPSDVMEGFVREHTADIAFACSDADSTYAEVFKSMNVAHYVHPSNYTDIIFKAGYEQPSHTDRWQAQQQRESNDRILERLWEDGMIDHIDNRGKMTYAQFMRLKQDNDLSLGLVNQLHNDLKEFVERDTKGVATRYLPYYVAWFAYVKNMTVDLERVPKSRKDAEAVLVDIVNSRVNLSPAKFDEIQQQPLSRAIEQTSGRYIHLLDKNTRKVRESIGNPSFSFGDEDGVESFNARSILSSMPNGKLRELAKLVKVKGATHMARWTLIDELLAKPDLDKHLLIVAATGADSRHDCTPTNPLVNTYFDNRIVPPSLLPQRLFTSPQYADGKVAFIDVETTGLIKEYDEILSVAIVSLDGEVLFDEMFKPRRRKRWKKAQAVNRISPADVADKPLLEERKEELEGVLRSIDCLVGWNMRFDLQMLYANDIDIPIENEGYCDLMPAFCKAWGKAMSTYKRQEREKLENAAEWLGLAYEKHTSLGDASVLIDIWNWVLNGS